MSQIFPSNDASYLNLLTSGEESVPRVLASGGIPLSASGALHLVYWTARKTETITQLRSRAHSTAASGLTLAKMGVYEADAAGDLTRVATITSDTTLWTSIGASYTRSTTASWTKVARRRYAFAFLAVGTTMPTIVGYFTDDGSSGLAPRTSGVVGGQTDLPSTINNASVTADYNLFLGIVLP